MIVVQEAESHVREIVTSAEQHFHVYGGADQLILFLKDTCEPDGVKTEEVILGTSKQYLMVTSRFSRPPKLCNTYTAVSAHLKNTTAKRFSPGKSPKKERKLCRVRKGKDELDRRSTGIDFADSPWPDLVPNVGPDGGLRRLLRPGTDKEERVELACCKARKPSA